MLAATNGRFKRNTALQVTTDYLLKPNAPATCTWPSYRCTIVGAEDVLWVYFSIVYVTKHWLS